MSSVISRLDLQLTAGAERGPSTCGTRFRRLRYWFQVARERRQLASLSDASLRDIGISRADAMGEYYRQFWDVPPCR
jgi:uncharacterized protein YjiS (DUF1127 family)